MNGEINYPMIAGMIALASIGFSGVMMAGASFWPQQAEQYKKNIPTIITGVLLAMAAVTLVGYFTGGN